MSEISDQFIYVCTQIGVENACKQQILEQFPAFRFAFSRPGFLTFKIDASQPLPANYDLKNVFVRSTGFTGPRLNFMTETQSVEAQLTKAQSTDAGNAQQQSAEESAASNRTRSRHTREMVQLPEFRDSLRSLLEQFDSRHIHVWSRDVYAPGDAMHPVDREAMQAQHYTPGQSRWLRELIDTVSEVASQIDSTRFAINQVAAQNDRVLDLILVDPKHVWSGRHTISSSQSRWPGGIPPLEPPAKMISRAWLKMTEGLVWARFPLDKRDVCVEIGAAPGGSCQALLDRGARVIGIDPAQMDEKLLQHDDFTWIRARGAEVRCKDLKDAKWLFSDTNVAPAHTLDTVERIVTNGAVRIRGMLLTIKLTKAELAREIPGLIERVRGMGFNHVRVRQLANNRQEFCLAALRNKAMLRFGDRKREEWKVEGGKSESETPEQGTTEQGTPESGDIST